MLQSRATPQLPASYSPLAAMWDRDGAAAASFHGGHLASTAPDIRQMLRPDPAADAVTCLEDHDRLPDLAHPAARP